MNPVNEDYKLRKTHMRNTTEKILELIEANEWEKVLYHLKTIQLLAEVQTQHLTTNQRLGGTLCRP